MPDSRLILFATDFSETARRALEFAGVLARLKGGRVHAIHVVARHPTEEEVEEARAGLEREVAGMGELVAGREVVRAISPEIGILDTAKRLGAELVVLGTHGRTGFKHVLLGSVAERVVRLAPCAVLTVNRADGGFERP